MVKYIRAPRVRPNGHNLQPFFLPVQLNFVRGRTGAFYVAYEEHHTENKIKVKRNHATHLSCAELRTGLLAGQSRACDTVTTQRWEIQ